MSTFSVRLFNPEEIADPKGLREALERANRQIIRLSCQLEVLTCSTQRLNNELAVMSEAYIAGDNKLVASKVRGFALAYYQNLKSAHRRTH